MGDGWRIVACAAAVVVSVGSSHSTRTRTTEELVSMLKRGHHMRDARDLPIEGIPDDFECEWRVAAMHHAKVLQPFLTSERQQALCDALEIKSKSDGGGHPHPSCADKNVSCDALMWEPQFVADTRAGTRLSGPSSRTVYLRVSSAAELVRVLQEQKMAWASSRSELHEHVVIGLAPGVYRLNQTLILGPEHSHTTLTSAEIGGMATISGARLLSGLRWQNLETSSYRSTLSAVDQSHVFVADVPDDFGPAGITALRVDGLRATRARYPNADPEYDQFPKGYVLEATNWLPPKKRGPAVAVTIPLADAYPTVDTPPEARPTDWGQYHFAGAYRMGFNGSCSILTPPQSYWCQPDGRTGGDLYFVRTPSGIHNITSLLPHSPYRDAGKDLMLTYWRPGHWFSVQYNLSRPIDGSTGDALFGTGGFQGAEGHDEGAEWFVENVLEELDAPNEFFHDKELHKLLLYYNGTGPPPGEVEVPMLAELISVQGTVQDPVRGLHLANLSFTGQRPTYLDPHGIPSAGDWGLEHVAALHFAGTVGSSVEGCLFLRLDGNAILLSGFNRETIIKRNEFRLLGGSAVALWGDEEMGNGEVRGGEQPRGTIVEENFCHEIGIYQKQSSCYFHAVSAQSDVRRNIFFNGPRAMVNFNDNFGGGHELILNLIFNSCRESSDHGAFNSWGRQPYLTTVGTNGTRLSAEPAYSRLQNNFIVANYAANGGCFDNDDGSSWYLEQNNFCVYGGMKNDFEGSNKRSSNNVHAFPCVYGEFCLNGINQVSAHYAEGYWNNTCVLSRAGAYYLSLVQLGPSHRPVPTREELHTLLGGNRIYAPAANVRVSWKATMAIEEWLKLGLDEGTVALDSAGLTSAEIVRIGLEVLQAPPGPEVPTSLPMTSRLRLEHFFV